MAPASSKEFLDIQATVECGLTLKLVRDMIKTYNQTANCFYFNLNVLKFELQYEWTPPQMLLCGYHVLQLFCHNVQGAHDIKCSQK